MFNISTINKLISNTIDIDENSNKINKFSNYFYILIIFVFSIIGTFANFIVIAAYKLSINYKIQNNNPNKQLNNRYSIDNAAVLAAAAAGSNFIIDDLSGKKKNKLSQQQQYHQFYYNSNNKPRRSISQNIANQSNINNKINNEKNNTETCTNKLNLNKIRRTLCSYFILSLGFCDLFICIINMPLNALIEIDSINKYLVKIFINNSKTIDLNILCKLSYFLLQIPIILEIEILFTIALDRYSSVFKPIKLYFFDINKLILTLVVQILCAGILSSPNLLFIVKNSDFNYIDSGNKTTSIPYIFIKNEFKFCEVNSKFQVFHTWYQIFLCFLFILNLVIISIFYLKVYKHIYKASKHQRLQNATSASRNSVNTLQVPISTNGLNILLTNSTALQHHTTTTATVSSTNVEFSLYGSLHKQNDSSIDEGSDHQKNKNLFKLLKLKNMKLKQKNEMPDVQHDLVVAKRYSASNLRRQLAINNQKNKLQLKCVSLEGNGYTSNSCRVSSGNKKVLSSPRRLSVPVIPSSGVIPTPIIIDSKIEEQKRISISNEEKNKQRARCVSLTPNMYQIPNEIFNSQNRLFRRHISRPFKHGKTARILGISTLAFLLTWVPYWYYVIFTESRFETEISSASDESTTTTMSHYYYQQQVLTIIIINDSKYYLKKLLKNLFYLNYVLNPFFYSFVNQRFRQNVYNLFFKFQICKNIKLFKKFKKLKNLNIKRDCLNSANDRCSYDMNQNLKTHQQQNQQLLQLKQQQQQQQKHIIDLCKSKKLIFFKTPIKEVDEISTKKNSVNNDNTIICGNDKRSKSLFSKMFN
jgi:hypothetical protein